MNDRESLIEKYAGKAAAPMDEAEKQRRRKVLLHWSPLWLLIAFVIFVIIRS